MRIAGTPTVAVPRSVSLEERASLLQDLVAQADPELLAAYRERLQMSWVYHDSALEGVVYTFHELKVAIDARIVSDSSLIPVYDEIRQHKAAIDYVLDLADRKRFSVNQDVMKNIYMRLAPDECEGKGQVRYRKDMPLHRLYFHEISQPDKVAQKMRQLILWMNAPDTKRSMHPVRLAARAHHELLHIYPFHKHSGKVARLVMNLVLLKHGYPPAIIHSTERQRYYESLRLSSNAVATMINEALLSSVDSALRFFGGEDRVDIARAARSA